MSFEEQDPEVIADLQLREATTRDKSRTGKFPQWHPPVIVGTVKCRVTDCENTYEWTKDAEEALEDANKYLVNRGEAPLDRNKIVFCLPCRTRGLGMVAKHNRERVSRMTELIRKLKEADNPEQEYDLLRRIRAQGHPDVDGLVKAMRERLDRERERLSGRSRATKGARL